MSEKPEKYSETQKCLHPIISCSLTVIFTSTYIFGIWSELTLKGVNMLCLPLFFIELTIGLIENINKKKAILLLAANFISIAVGGLNIWSDYQTIGAFRLSGLSGWSFVWTVLFIVAFFSSLTILLRLFFWSQDHWEAYRKSRQEHRSQNKLFWFEYRSSQNTHRLTIQEINQKYQQQLLEDKLQNKRERKKIKRESLKEQLVSESQCEEDRKKIHGTFWAEFDIDIFKELFDSFKTLLESITRWGVLISFAVGFFVFPYANSLRNGVSDWFDAVKVLVESLKKDGSFENGQQALLYYMLFYSFAVVTVFMAWRLIIPMVMHKVQQKTTDSFNFLATYQLPIAILVVFGTSLYVLTDGNLDFSGINEGWQILLLIIFVVLILFTAIEIVRIVIAQCADPNSLLKKLIYLIFVAILKLLSELLLGIIINFRIQLIINSLFELVFPETDESENFFNNRLKRKLDHLFDESIIHTENDPVTASTSKAFGRKKIWRRRKK